MDFSEKSKFCQAKAGEYFLSGFSTGLFNGLLFVSCLITDQEKVSLGLYAA